MCVLVNWKCTHISTENCIFTLWVVNHNEKRKWQKYGRIKVIQCLHGNLIRVITCHHLYDSNVKKSPLECWLILNGEQQLELLSPCALLTRSECEWIHSSQGYYVEHSKPRSESTRIQIEWEEHMGESGQIGNWKSYGMNIRLFVIQTRKSGKFDRFLRFKSRPSFNDFEKKVGFARSSAKVYEMH